MPAHLAARMDPNDPNLTEDNAYASVCDECPEAAVLHLSKADALIAAYVHNRSRHPDREDPPKMEHPSSNPDPAARAQFLKDQQDAATVAEDREATAWALNVAQQEGLVSRQWAKAARDRGRASLLEAFALLVNMIALAGGVAVLVLAVAYIIGLFR